MKKALLTKILLIAAMLVGCAHPSHELRDGGPNRIVDVNAIPDTIAKPVTRTAAGNKSPYTVLGKTYAVLESSRGYVAEGTASWYGSKFHGRNTSNGEVFDMYGLTAAHKHLPIPTYAEITNLENNRKITVRINDRGPFHSNRIIDLSWAAAAKLGFSDIGTAKVRVVALDPDTGRVPTPPIAETPVLLPAPTPASIPAPSRLPSDSYYQIAALSDRFGASQLARDVEALTKYPVAIEWNDALTNPVYKILIGPLSDRREIDFLGKELELAGLEKGFLIQLEQSSAAKGVGNI